MDIQEMDRSIVVEAAAAEPLIFDEDITFSWEYNREDEIVPHALFTPSSAKSDEPAALIVWLHGYGERALGEEVFRDSGLMKVMSEWQMEGFHAYVLCPQLMGLPSAPGWTNPITVTRLKSLLDRFVSEHNVDAERIIIAGHSLGGRGTMYMASELSGYFSKMAVLSGDEPNVDLSQIRIPARGYVGLGKYGEDSASMKYMNQYFVAYFGESSLFTMESSHSALPLMAFTEDRDGDNCSDLIQWMLT